jgi:hypothetical protein
MWKWYENLGSQCKWLKAMKWKWIHECAHGCLVLWGPSVQLSVWQDLHSLIYICNPMEMWPKG